MSWPPHSGVECFSTVASDSPTRVLNLRAIWLRVFRTSSRLAACRLLLVEDISGIAGLRAQAQNILASKARDRAFENRGAPGSLADLLRDFRSQPRIFRLPHQSQRLLDLLVRNQTEERRLLQAPPTAPGAACRQTPDRPSYYRNPQGQWCPCRSAWVSTRNRDAKATRPSLRSTARNYDSRGCAEGGQPVPAEKLARPVQPARRRGQHGPVLHVPLDIGCEV